MVLRSRRRRTGPGPTGTALVLLALVLAVAYVYYETPLIQAGGAAARPPGPPRLAWSADLPEGWAAGGPGDLVLSVGERHILAARLLPGAVEAVWYDRFGYAAAQSGPVPRGDTGGTVLAASGLLVAVGPAGGSDPPGEPGVPAVRVVSPASLPEGLAWTPAAPTAGIEPVAVNDGLLAVAAFGAPAGPNLAPDLLAVLDHGRPQPVIRWSQPYDQLRLIQAAGGPAALAVTAVDPARGQFQVELWSWQGDRLWSSDLSAEPVRLLAVGPAAGGDPAAAPPRAYVAAGAGFTALGPGGGGRVLEDPEPPRQCWPVGHGVACLRAPDPGGRGAELLFLTAGGRVSRYPLAGGATVWPWPGHGALVAAGDPSDSGDPGRSSHTLTAFDAAGARWTVDLPLEPRALAAGDDGVAAGDGRRLVWLQWPVEGPR